VLLHLTPPPLPNLAVPGTVPSSPAPELTVLMPCLNESATLAVCISKARACIDRLGLCSEIVIADNGSTDGSQQIAEEAGARVVAVTEPGYGAALYYGVLAARGRFIVMADADDSYDFSAMDPFVEKLRQGYDLVMGDRFHGGIATGAMPWKNRYIGNPGLSFIGRLFFRCPVGDFHCGMRAFSRGAFDRMDLQTTGMEFASELVIKATLLDMRIAEVPTTLSRDGRNRPPHLRPWRDGWRHLRFMLLYSPRWLFLYPGVLLMLLGLTVGGLLLPGPIMLTPMIGLDVHTLLFAFAAVLVGFQAVAFAVFARVYAFTEGLLPHDKALERLFKTFTLEVGLAAGAVLLILGFGGALYAVARWSAAGFGMLDARETLRTAIPSAAAICLGGQVVLTSFLLSFLGLRKR
jgi:glycosyltransferase involved in cell wall biosynthesis